MPWTDKYQPTHSSEIVGNSNNVKKLKTWLIEWKHKVDKEAKKMKKLAMKESKNKTKEKGLLNIRYSWVPSVMYSGKVVFSWMIVFLVKMLHSFLTNSALNRCIEGICAGLCENLTLCANDLTCSG